MINEDSGNHGEVSPTAGLPEGLTKGGSQQRQSRADEIRPGKAVVARTDVGAVLALIEGSRHLTDREVAVQHLGFSADEPLTQEIFTLLSRIAVLTFDSDGIHDTLATIQSVRDTSGIDVRPLFRFYPLNHWSLLPGEDCEPPKPGAAIRASRWQRPSAALPRNVGRPSTPTPLPSTMVFALDSGFHLDHAWRDGLPWVGPLQAADIETAPGDNHGTFVGCVIGACSPQTHVRVLKVRFKPNAAASGKAYELVPEAEREYDEISIAHALERVKRVAGALEAVVINMSFGSYKPHLPNGPVLEDVNPLSVEESIEALLESVAHGSTGNERVLLVAAAGNRVDHQTPAPGFEVAYPARRPDVLAVGAADENDAWTVWDVGGARTSGPGDFRTAGVDVLAPGTDLVGPVGQSLPFGSYVRPVGVKKWSGSSFAAAVVSGLVAFGFGADQIRQTQVIERDSISWLTFDS